MGHRDYIPFINQCNLAIYPVTPQCIDRGFIEVITLECSGHFVYLKSDVSPHTQKKIYKAWEHYKTKLGALYNRVV